MGVCMGASMGQCVCRVRMSVCVRVRERACRTVGVWTAYSPVLPTGY